MNAIPTIKYGIRFRSRLEAKWATVFTILGWKWHYEPIDLNGYIPDFILEFKKPLLVEVKPVIGFGFWSEPLEKIKASGWADEAILLGATIGHGENHCDSWRVGNLWPGRCEECWLDSEGTCCNCSGWDECYVKNCLACGNPTPVAGYGRWDCRVCLHYDGKRTTQDFEGFDIAWKHASNEVQWGVRDKPDRWDQRPVRGVIEGIMGKIKT